MNESAEQLSRALSEMARGASTESVVLLQKKVAIDILGGVIKRTAVDEGRVRGNWQVDIGDSGAATERPAEKGEVGDPAGPALQDGIGKLAGLEPFQTVWIVNPLAYAFVLDQGGYVPADPANTPEAMARRARRRSPGNRERALLKFGNEGATFVRGGYSYQSPRGMVDVTIASVLEAIG